MHTHIESSIGRPGVGPVEAPLRYGTHLIVAVAIALVAPFTGLAWPFALLVGMLVGGDDAAKLRGEASGLGSTLAGAIAAAAGILAMLFFGAILGGLVAIVVVALAAFSERAAAFASPTDRGVARILLFIAPIIFWMVLIALGANLEISIGG